MTITVTKCDVCGKEKTESNKTDWIAASVVYQEPGNIAGSLMGLQIGVTWDGFPIPNPNMDLCSRDCLLDIVSKIINKTRPLPR